MPLVILDRVQETTTTAGTGTVTLAGAVTGFRSFAEVGNGNTTYYVIAGQGTSEWEVGIGTYTSAGTTLSRTTVLASSNAGALVNFSAGTKNVFVTYPAGRSVVVDGTTVIIPNNARVPTANGGTNLSSFTANGILYASSTSVLATSTGLTYNGTTLSSSILSATNSINSPNTFGYKNRLINGNMQISQRATSATVTAGTGVPTASTGYPCVDRFFVYSTGANVTAARVAGTGAVRNRLQITGAASVTAVGVGQRIEQSNSYDLAGSTCTLSVDLANSLLTTVTWTASYATTADTFGTIGTPTKTQIATGTFTVNSTVTRYSTQISVPAAATTGIEILFTVGAQTSGTWTIGNVQFELGSAATSFDTRSVSTESLLCYRYHWDSSPGSATQAIQSGGPMPGAGNYTTPPIIFPVGMRTAPTVTVRDAVGTNASAIVVTPVTATAAQTYITTTANANAFVNYNVALSAEL